MNVVELHSEKGAYKIAVIKDTEDCLQRDLLAKRVPYEHAMLRDVAARIEPGALFIDVGANIGNHTLYVASLGCRVVAFEPNPLLTPVLRHSIRLNGFDRRVTLHELGVGKEPGTAVLDGLNPKNIGSQYLTVRDGGDIRIIPLDSMEFEPPVGILKIDVEGMEYDVLMGAKKTIAAHRPLLYIESGVDEEFRRIFNYLLRERYFLTQAFNRTPTHLFIPFEFLDEREKLAILNFSSNFTRYKLDEVFHKTQKIYVSSMKIQEKTVQQDISSALSTRCEQLQDEIESLRRCRKLSMVRFEDKRKELGEALETVKELRERQDFLQARLLEAEAESLEQKRRNALAAKNHEKDIAALQGNIQSAKKAHQTDVGNLKRQLNAMRQATPRHTLKKALEAITRLMAKVFGQRKKPGGAGIASAHPSVMTEVNGVWKRTEPVPIKNLPYSFTLKDIQSGEYLLTITHNERAFFENRKSLFVKFESDDFPSYKELYTELHSSRNDSEKFAFAYFGGGKTAGKGFSQSFSFYTRKSSFSLTCTVVGKKNNNSSITSIQFSRKSNIFLSFKIRNQLEKRFAGKRFDYIVYGDINLGGIIDGSSIWLVLMSQIAATYGKTLVVLKCNNSRIDELKNDNIEFLRPADLGLKENFYDHEAVNCIKSLDMIMPGLRRIVVRGLAVAELLLAGDVFPYRTVMYLNDFVELANGRYDISPAKAERVRNVLRGGDLFLVQTPELARVMRGLADEDFAFELMPPPVPDTMPRCRKRKAPDPHTGTISIGYSGKIARGWGIDTLLDWTARIRRTGINVALTIIAGKINLPKKEADMFLKRVREAQVDFYQALPQKEVHALMSGMDFSWCYRDAELEDTAVEVSSKLLEGVAMGLRCLCYPNHINKRVLGSRYPFFLSTYAEFEHLLLHVRRYNGTALANRILSTYSQSAVAASLDKIRLRGSTISKSICFAGEQLGELRRYASFLKAKGHRVVLDIWQDNGTSDARWSEQCLHANETVVCVWGKCAVWYAARKDGARKLCVLVPAGTDLREDPKAKLVIWEHVEKIIFSSEQARDSFLDDFKGYQGETYVIDAAAPFIERMEEALQPDSPFPARIREKRHD